MSKFTIEMLAFVAFVLVIARANAEDMGMDKVEDSTVSPIADMAIIDADMKTSTERPPVMEEPKHEERPASQRHTVADFIIHPLIAFKPRNPEDDSTATAGKQANNEATSSTTPSPWQLFGFNAGQGLGSQVTNLAGQVSGWLNDRIQFPGLVETPVRESTTTSTSTTTTPRPDIVVRVQHKASTRRPIIAINNRNRPNRPQFESEENDDEDEDEEENEEENNGENEEENNGENNNSDEAPDDNESSNEGSDEVDADQNNSKDEDDDDHEEDHSQRPNHKRHPLRNNSNKNRNGQRRRVRPQQQSNRRRPHDRPQRRRPTVENEVSDEEVQDDDDYADNDNVYYSSRPSTKRSQSSPNFIQRGQQQLINQIMQFTRGQTPAEVGNAIRKSQRVNAANNRLRQQATLFVNRNGQTIYVAPELAQMTAPQYQQIYAQPIVQKPVVASPYPQPPLTIPLKRKGQPTQYITIPWAQLGISPPNNIVSITEGIQSKPLILNIPQSAINTMQQQAMGHSRPKKKKRPQLITPDAVPLLAEASLMDIFNPPQIPPSRHVMPSSSKPIAAASVTPVIIAAAKPSSTKTTSTLLQQRVRPGTIIEKAPEVDVMKTSVENESKTEEGPKTDMLRGTGENEFILVGDDNEPGLTRHVEPVYGDARYVRLAGKSEFFDVLPRRRFAVRRGGRELDHISEMAENTAGSKTEQLIPVQIVNEPEVPSPMGESAKRASSESPESENPAMDTILSDSKPAIVPANETSAMDTVLNDPKSMTVTAGEIPALDTVLTDPKPMIVPASTQQSLDGVMTT